MRRPLVLLAGLVLFAGCKERTPNPSALQADAAFGEDRLGRLIDVRDGGERGELIGDPSQRVFPETMESGSSCARQVEIPKKANGHIAEVPNGVLRNRAITTEYFRLAKLMRATLDCPQRVRGASRVRFEANWFHFGIFASRAAGQLMSSNDATIRAAETATAASGSLLPKRLRSNKNIVEAFEFILRELGWHQDIEWNLLQKKYTSQLAPPMEAFGMAMIEYTQTQLARGNWLLAREVIPHTWKFLALASEQCTDTAMLSSQDVPAPSDALKAYLDELWGGRFPATLRASDLSSVLDGATDMARRFTSGKVTWTGQYRKALAVSYYAYHRVMFERDRNARSEWLHLGNVFIGVHEQMLVQDYLNRAVGVLNGRKPKTNPLTPVLHRAIMNAAFPTGPKPVVDCRLGPRDVNMTVFSLSKAINYADFARSNDDVKNLDVVPVKDFLTDPTLGARRGRRGALSFPGVADWTDYPKRMSYLAGLFRALHYHSNLEAVPWAEQCDVVEALGCVTSPPRGVSLAQGKGGQGKQANALALLDSSSDGPANLDDEELFTGDELDLLAADDTRKLIARFPAEQCLFLDPEPNECKDAGDASDAPDSEPDEPLLPPSEAKPSTKTFDVDEFVRQMYVFDFAENLPAQAEVDMNGDER